MNSAKSNKNIEREELAFSDVEEDEEEDDEFGHHVTELELDKIADLMKKREDTVDAKNPGDREEFRSLERVRREPYSSSRGGEGKDDVEAWSTCWSPWCGLFGR